MSAPRHTISTPLLKEAAAAVIACLQMAPGLSQVPISIIGGLAVSHYLPRGRTTGDVDFWVGIQDAPNVLKAKLREARCFIDGPVFCLRTAAHGDIPIDFIPMSIPPIAPAIQKTHDTIKPDGLPFADPLTLAVMKIHCCSMRRTEEKKFIDSSDSKRLVKYLRNKGTPIVLSPDQGRIIEESLPSFLPYSSRAEWWSSDRLRL